MSGTVTEPSRRYRILVIEDEFGVARGLRTLLFSRGYDVDLAATPSEALRYIARNRYGLVVVDFNLGDEDGVTLVREIRRIAPRIPIFAVTAVDRETASSAADDLDLAGCFQKPVIPEALLDAVARHVSD
jgi:DNA-binding response OmpR family regulator